MQIVFILISVFQLTYFTVKKRETDLYTVAFFSALIYFLPGFFGYAIYPGRIYVDLNNEVYVVFSLVITSIWFGAFIKDNTVNKRKFSISKKIRIKETKFTSISLALISLMLTIYYVVKLNVVLLEPKNIMMPLLGTSFVLLKYSASLSFVLGYLEKNKKTFVISSFILLFIFFIGFRGPIAMTAITIIIIMFKEKGIHSLYKSNVKQIILIGLFGYIMIMGKSFYYTFKSGGILEAFKVLFNSDYIIISFSSIESFTIQSILNEIIEQDFKIGLSHLQGVLYQLLIVPSNFIETNQFSFNYLFQSSLFPDVEYGMAYNFWAEAIASGGYLFLFVIISIFLFGIMVFDRLIHSPSNLVKGVSALLGTYWVFIIHRSSISTMFTQQRHLFYTLLVGMIMSVIIYVFLEVIRRNNRGWNT